MEHNRRKNDAVRNAIHADISNIKGSIASIEKLLSGNGRPGIVEIVRRHAIYFKAIGVAVVAIVGAWQAGVF